MAAVGGPKGRCIWRFSAAGGSLSGPKGRCLEVVGRRRRSTRPERPLYGGCWPQKADSASRRAATWNLLAAEGCLRGSEEEPLFGSCWQPEAAYAARRATVRKLLATAARLEGPLFGGCWSPKSEYAALRAAVWRLLAAVACAAPRGPLFGSCWLPQRGSKGRYWEVVGRRSQTTQP